MSILVTTQNTKGVNRNKDRFLPNKNNQIRKRESKPLGSRVRDSDEESYDLCLFLPAVKTIGEFEER